VSRPFVTFVQPPVHFCCNADLDVHLSDDWIRLMEMSSSGTGSEQRGAKGLDDGRCLMNAHQVPRLVFPPEAVADLHLSSSAWHSCALWPQTAHIATNHLPDSPVQWATAAPPMSPAVFQFFEIGYGAISAEVDQWRLTHRSVNRLANP